MYEINCSSCGHVTGAAFVRAGAVATCPRCGKKWQVQSDEIRRTVTIAPAGAAVATRGAGTEPPGEMSGDFSGVSGGAGAIGGAEAGATEISGHASAMPPRREAEAFFAAPPASAAASPAFTLASPSPSEAAPSRLRGLRRRAGLRLVIFAAVLIVGVGVLAWFTSTRPGSQAGSTGTAGFGSGGDVGAVLSHNPTASTLPGEPLAASPWRRVDEVLPPVREKAPVRLEDGHLVGARGDGHLLLVGRVVNDRPEVVMSAVLRLSLVNQDLRIFARCELPLALLPPGRAADICVPTPRELAARMVMIEGAVTEVASRADVVVFSETNVVLAPQGSGRMRLVQVKAFNPLEQALERTHLVVTGLGSRGRVVGRWRITWGQATPPRQRIDFFAIVPELETDIAKVESWGVTVVAEPVRGDALLTGSSASPSVALPVAPSEAPPDPQAPQPSTP